MFKVRTEPSSSVFLEKFVLHIVSKLPSSIGLVNTFEIMGEKKLSVIIWAKLKEKKNHIIL